MAIEKVTYVAGSASIVRLPDGKKVLLEIVPIAVRMRKLNAFGRASDTLWEHRFPTEIGVGSPLAETALDLSLDSIERAFSIDDAVRTLNESAKQKLEALLGPQQSAKDETGPPTPDPATVKRYQSAHVRARWVLVLLAATVALDLIAVRSDLAEARLLSRAINGALITDAEATANDTRQQSIASMQLLLFAGTGIAFLMWLHRSYRNLQALNAHDLRFSPGWVVGYFFIPILNLFRPYQAVVETWKASDPTTLHATAWKDSRASLVVGGWWFFWLIAILTYRASSGGILSTEEELSSLLAESVATAIADGIEVIAALLAILVVHGIDRRQENKFRILSDAVGAA